jgi:hypothetical protein
MIELATVDQIRQRLRLGSLTTDQSAALDVMRQAIEERVLLLTGFLVTDDPYFSPSRQVEEQIDVQIGLSRLMQYRPLISMSSTDPQKTIILEARSLASGTFNTILGDIRDKKTGRVMPLASELTPVFPPIGGLAPWFRWRQMIWPVVRFTYLVDPLGSPTNPVPKALTMAVVEWTAFLIARNPGLVQSFTAEKISESYYFNWMIPPIVTSLLSIYIRTKASIIF